MATNRHGKYQLVPALLKEYSSTPFGRDHPKGLVEGGFTNKWSLKTIEQSIIIGIIGAIQVRYRYYGYVITMVSAVLSGKWYV